MNTLIVGAGISGLTLALLLARQGRQVFIYDKRTVFDQQTEGRSINFTISGRGIAVFEQLGLKEKVVSHSAILLGRVVHLQNSKAVQYKYGTQKSHVLLSIRRSTLIDILLNEIAHESRIRLYAGLELIAIDKATLTCHFLNTNNKKDLFVKADWIIGADGVFSNVRRFMLEEQLSSYQQTVFNWGYKEYQFDENDAKKLQISSNHMHMWPKSNALLVAIPNTDSTFSVIFTAPVRREAGQLNNFNKLVREEYKDILNVAPSFLNKCGDNPFNNIISIKIDKWHFDDRVILVGDACHATYPFYGQGMNSALEDAVILSNYINSKSLSRLDAFIAYEKSRKKDTNALHELSEAHLHQMTKSMLSSFWQACNVLDYKLAKLLPKKWVYEYEMVAHSTLSYFSILEVVRKQSKKKLISGFYIVAFILGIIMHANKCIISTNEK